MRISAVLMLAVCLAACNRGAQQSNDAVRQGVIDHLVERKSVSLENMDVQVTSVKFNGDQADAVVSFTPKGGKPEQGMSIPYHLEQKNNKWTVIRTNSKDAPHGGAAMPATENPHGGGAVPAPGGSGKMPSPEDLPPAKKK